jgi:hypothetical protein
MTRVTPLQSFENKIMHKIHKKKHVSITYHYDIVINTDRERISQRHIRSHWWPVWETCVRVGRLPYACVLKSNGYAIK